MFLSDNGDFPIWKWGIFLPILRIFYWQNTLGLELLPCTPKIRPINLCFNALSGLSCYGTKHILRLTKMVSMPSRAWVVTHRLGYTHIVLYVSMPSRAWVVTARIYNILNFSWYFLYIPAIYKCILAYFPIFFNQVSKFLRCESPSTFLGTCLSHHSFIILLITSTSALLTGLYLISTDHRKWLIHLTVKRVNALSGLYLISTANLAVAWSG